MLPLIAGAALWLLPRGAPATPLQPVLLPAPPARVEAPRASERGLVRLIAVQTDEDDICLRPPGRVDMSRTFASFRQLGTDGPSLRGDPDFTVAELTVSVHADYGDLSDVKLPAR